MRVPHVRLESVLHLALVVLGEFHGGEKRQGFHPRPHLWGDGATQLGDEVKLVLFCAALEVCGGEGVFQD